MNLDTQRINYVSTDDTDLLNRLNVAALESWSDNNVLLNSGLVRIEQLVKGAWSYRFKFRGKFSGDPSHHSAGQFIIGRTRVNSSTDIEVDTAIIEAEDFDNAELDLTNYNELAASVRECTRTIAELLDKRMFRLGILAARTSSVTNVHNGGNVVEATANTVELAYPVTAAGALAFKKNLRTLARLQDEDHVPEGTRVAFITPYIREVLMYETEYISYDYQDPMNVVFKDRFLGRAEGYALVTTRSHMPSTNITTDLSKYNGNFSAGASSQREPVCLVLSGDGENYAIGGVERSPLRTKAYESEDHDAIRVQARIHMGLGILAPWCAGEIGVAVS